MCVSEAKIYAEVNYMENKKKYIRLEFTEVETRPEIGSHYMGAKVLDVEPAKVGLKQRDKTVFDYDFFRVTTDEAQYDVCKKREVQP